MVKVSETQQRRRVRIQIILTAFVIVANLIGVAVRVDRCDGRRLLFLGHLHRRFCAALMASSTVPYTRVSRGPGVDGRTTLLSGSTRIALLARSGQCRPHAGEHAAAGIVDVVDPRHLQDRHIEVAALPLNRAQHLFGSGEQQVAMQFEDSDTLASVID